MNFFEFKAERFLKELQRASMDLWLSLNAGMESNDDDGLRILAALQQNIDVMQRVDADRQNKNAIPLGGDEISRIGDYALKLLDELATIAGGRGMQQCMRALQRLSIPLAQWIAEHDGRIRTLDIIVNAYAAYANETEQPDKLQQISDSIGITVHAVADDIRRDLEPADPLRPWRILNFNWGIVATRSHDLNTMQRVFDQMMENIPADARFFFREGLQQMDVVAYPDHVRALMEKYNRLVGNAESLH